MKYFVNKWRQLSLPMLVQINNWCVFYPHYVAFIFWYAMQQFGTI